MISTTAMESLRGYVCRGCGTVITTPASFRKCPVCGIRIN